MKDAPKPHENCSHMTWVCYLPAQPKCAIRHSKRLWWNIRKSLWSACSKYLEVYLEFKFVYAELALVPFPPGIGVSVLCDRYHVMHSYPYFHYFFRQKHLTRDSYFRQLGRMGDLAQPWEEVAAPAKDFSLA